MHKVQLICLPLESASDWTLRTLLTRGALHSSSQAVLARALQAVVPLPCPGQHGGGCTVGQFGPGQPSGSISRLLMVRRMFRLEGIISVKIACSGCVMCTHTPHPTSHIPHVKARSQYSYLKSYRSGT